MPARLFGKRGSLKRSVPKRHLCHSHMQMARRTPLLTARSLKKGLYSLNFEMLSSGMFSSSNS